MAFNRFRPTSHFIAPDSWMNDPCGAVYVPETKEYLFCYQWNPGTTDGGNSAWGMARSKDLVTWEDVSPAIRNGATYDRLGVFSGSIASRIVDGKRVLFLFYTSISAVPIHWSVDYIEGCESQSVAFSTDFGRTWNRYENNPLMTVPPKKQTTTGWRDPFVSRWKGLSDLLGQDASTEYMMIASGEKGVGPELHLYQSSDLLNWKPVSAILSVEEKSRVAPDFSSSQMSFGMNFECASFFSIGERHYMIVGVEEDHGSDRHNGHCLLWMSGDLALENGKPKFVIKNHGSLDHGVAYAAHVFRDAEGRLLQLGWADETAPKNMVRKQGWAGCLAHPRELYEISRPIAKDQPDGHIWRHDEAAGTMSTLGFRPAPQVSSLRKTHVPSGLKAFPSLKSKNFEIRCCFQQPKQGKFSFDVRASELERTRIILDCENNCITVDKSESSIEKFGLAATDSGPFHMSPGEDLNVCIFVDNSIVEVYANDRFAMTSRIYPTLDSSTGVSYDFGGFDEEKIGFECWNDLERAWPHRTAQRPVSEGLNVILEHSEESTISGKGLASTTVVAIGI